jgi:hypothetical protein
MFHSIYRKICRKIVVRYDTLEISPQQQYWSVWFIHARISYQELHNCCHPLSMLPRYSPEWLICFENSTKMSSKLRKIIDYTCRLQNTEFQCPTLMNSMNVLYQVTRELLWRGRHVIATKCIKHKENIQSRIFSHTLHLLVYRVCITCWCHWFIQWN